MIDALVASGRPCWIEPRYVQAAVEVRYDVRARTSWQAPTVGCCTPGGMVKRSSDAYLDELTPVIDQCPR